MREKCAEYVRNLQDTICDRLAELDGGSFHEDTWERPGGGGGRSRVISEGALFEKGGVNVSEVHGALSDDFSAKLPGEGQDFYATGISLVLHPANPHVPTCHANFRYIEKGEKAWFGGGADLTPYYLYDEDAIHFHQTWKDACDRHSDELYRKLKKECDEYFFLPHRGEARGVGGIFFDYFEATETNCAFWRDVGDAFLDAYVPIAERRRDTEFGEPERKHQLQRRGRYVEFNLLYDRGTIFGLKTRGRIESILMSLPPFVRWDYDARPAEGSEEARLVEVLENPRDWLAP